ncbi:unnamed protein product [Rotaria sp. Silwood1]|nr:unnamed protein product [Rotaria sp. Silwood1]
MSSPTISTNNGNDSSDDVVPEPKCSTSKSRLAANDVLVKLVQNCLRLYNGGATCYMNSILQQLSMLPQISEHILSVPDDLDSANRTTKTSDSKFILSTSTSIWSFNGK